MFNVKYRPFPPGYLCVQKAMKLSYPKVMVTFSKVWYGPQFYYAAVLNY